MIKKLMIFLVILAVLIAALFFFEKQGEYSYKGKLELATEYPPPNEADATESIVNSLKKILEKDYPAPKRMKRDAHPKQHGLVKAEFTVLDNIDSNLKVGIFKEPKTYHSWIRYSNLSAGAPDINKDSRGMAIKLMGVEGQKILPQQADAQTHDFVFMSTQNFVTKDVKGFADLLTAINAPSKMKVIIHMLTHPRLLMLFLKVRIQIPDLFDVEWGSTTPYLLGEGQAVKYAILPAKPSGQTLPKDPAHDYLKDRMVETLKSNDVMLDFYVQVQTDAKKMPIEDPRVVWSRDLSPFKKVATIKVLKQTFDSPAQDLYGDQMSFTPWHALPENRPLGGINRGRKVIYDTMSKFRHANNNEVSTEPSDWIDF